ncbi:Peptidase C12 and PRP38 and CRAL TRIO domain cont aining protein [Trichuris trichiura]|uniref:ubiquitinyl hydrolase 1 n=1 Tax=Trichuris trichiura TaxID=36087 RepID=A0A077Z5Z3_TRITR|nr:Peptidase C12 and PRP38 and CRAL TRIO domain cont aining protein [Trichuris trichiura]
MGVQFAEDPSTELVMELRQRVSLELPTSYDTDFNLMRWIINADKMSRTSGNVDLAEKNLRNHLHFRRALHLDEPGVPTWDENPVYKDRLLPRGHFEWLQERNCFLWWVDYSTLNMSAIIRSQKSTDMLIYHFWKYELMLRTINEREKATGVRCSVYAVIDLRDWPINPLTLLFVNDGQMSYYANLFHYEHYPELVNPINMINAPTWISLPYRLVKSTMPKDFGSRFRILNHRFADTISKELPPEALPIEFGGTNAQLRPFTTVPSRFGMPEENETSCQRNKLERNEDLYHIYVNARRRKVIPVECKAGSTLLWHFTTDNALLFGIFFQDFNAAAPSREDSHQYLIPDVGHMEMVYPLLRFAAKHVPETGALLCRQAGTYYLTFCNRSSWWSRRHVYIKVEVRTTEVTQHNMRAEKAAGQSSGGYASAGIKTGSKQNTLAFWGNKQTMNLNHLVYENIMISPYYKNTLSQVVTYHEVLDEIYYNVDHLEPWERGTRKTTGQTGMCGGVRGVGAGGVVSSAFCILYKLFTLKLTRKQLISMLNHSDSCYIRGLGFMYVRYCLHPNSFWYWFEPYLDDEEEIDPKAGGGEVMTIGDMIRQMLNKLEWYTTLFPRIPVPIQSVLPGKSNSYLEFDPPYAKDFFVVDRVPNAFARTMSSVGQKSVASQEALPKEYTVCRAEVLMFVGATDQGLVLLYHPTGGLAAIIIGTPAGPVCIEIVTATSVIVAALAIRSIGESLTEQDTDRPEKRSMVDPLIGKKINVQAVATVIGSEAATHYLLRLAVNAMSEQDAANWCLIESDPAVFTEMIKGFGTLLSLPPGHLIEALLGCSGAEVQEVYSLSDLTSKNMGEVYGLIFLFKWQPDTQGIPPAGANGAGDVYFALQVVQNACASQALINLLLNCESKDVDIGSTLREFKTFTANMDPASRGLCLTNCDKIRSVHNSFSRPLLFELDSAGKREEHDAYHFITYVPKGGRVFELDGLAAEPVDLGTIPDGGDWLGVVHGAIAAKVEKYSSEEIRFNLMAIVPEKKGVLVKRLQEMIKVNDPALADQVAALQREIANEDKKLDRYKLENNRRRHNYVPFIVELIKVLAKEGKLTEMISEHIQTISKPTSAQQMN